MRASPGASMITLSYWAYSTEHSGPWKAAYYPMPEYSDFRAHPLFPEATRSAQRGLGKTVLRGLLGLVIGLVLGLVLGLLSGALVGAILGVVFEGPDSTLHTAAAISVIGLVCGGLVGIVLGFLMGLGVSLGGSYTGAAVGVILGAVIGAFLGGTIGLAIIGVTGAVGGSATVTAYRLVARYLGHSRD